MSQTGHPTDLMIYVPPYLASFVLLRGAIANVDMSSILDLTALAILLAGVFVVARYRAALAAADASARAWHEERDAALSARDRISEDLIKEKAETAALRLRPDLDGVAELLRNHEMNADRRADRIVAAIHDKRT